MTETTDKTLTVAPKKTLGLKRSGIERDTVRQSFSHGRTNTVQVERKKRRIVMPGDTKAEAPPPPVRARAESGRPGSRRGAQGAAAPAPGMVLRHLSDDEIDARAKALADAKVREAEERRNAEAEARRRIAEEARVASERTEAERRKAEEDERRKTEDAARSRAEVAARRDGEETPAPPAAPPVEVETAERPRVAKPEIVPEDDEAGALRGRIKTKTPAEVKPVKRPEERRRGKLTLGNALDDTERARSLASIRRRRERERARTHDQGPREKVIREVVIPETITIQELANRMAERAVEVIKLLMKQGQLVKAADVIDSDTAQLIAEEMGHTVRRVAESDVEEGLFSGRRGRRRSAAPSAGRDHHGSCRSRQDLAARRDPQGRCRDRRGRRHHPAYRRLSGRA